jgi:hypothetical protein
MKFYNFILGILLLSGGYIYAQQKSDLHTQWVHPGNDVIKENGYEGTQTCSICHQEALDEITHTVHWNLVSPVRNVQGLPDSSLWGMVNRECALAGSTCPSNWTAATNGKFSVQSAGCGICHIGSLPSPPMPGEKVTDAEANTVDCLVCHAENYDWSKRATLIKDSTGIHWGEDMSLKAALSITKTPDNEACLRCHEHSFSNDYKRGTPYTPENDVHAEAGLKCVTCHITEHHKIAKGMFESDMVANDLPNVDVSCSNCHGDSPHQGGIGKTLNEHIDKIACQTCHIPKVSGIVYEDWGKPVKDNINGNYSELSKYDKIPSNPNLYVPTDKIEMGYPSYTWRVPNTKEQKDAQNWLAFATANINTQGAKIFPVRGLTQIMLFDKELKMWQAPGMAFLKKSSQMPEFPLKMAEFPLLLSPNREVYNKTGNVKAAIDAGMKPYENMGLKWSGNWIDMQVPGTSYISVNHGIKKLGLYCNSCHSKGGVMDFKALGYTQQQVDQLEKKR